MYNNRAVSRTAAEIIQTYLTPRAALFVRFPVVGFFHDEKENIKSIQSTKPGKEKNLQSYPSSP